MITYQILISHHENKLQKISNQIGMQNNTVIKHKQCKHVDDQNHLVRLINELQVQKKCFIKINPKTFLTKYELLLWHEISPKPGNVVGNNLPNIDI